MEWLLAHKVLVLIIAWVAFLLLILRMWYVSHRGQKVRYLSPLYLILLNVALIVSAVNFVYRHKDHIVSAVIAWIITCVISIFVFYRKSMELQIEKHSKSELIMVPTVLFRLLFYFYVPALLVYFSIFTFAPRMLHGVVFISFFMALKGAITGVYLGFSLASFVQLHED